MKSIVAVLVMPFIFTTGCATQQKSIATGALIGATTGGILGNQVHGPKPQSSIIGAVVGAGIGALIGYTEHKNRNKTKGESKADEDIPEFAPMLKKSKVRMYWVPHQIKGKKFIEKHRIWEIETPNTWAN